MAALLLLASSGTAVATVYYSKNEAFELAFGTGATVEPQPVFLSETQVTAIEKNAGTKLDSPLFTFYVGKRGTETLGYAAIESHTVRTHPETLLVVLSPRGELAKIEVLAFHEPPEYQPPARWFAQLLGKPLERLRFGESFDAISGATLSSNAALASARKVLAIHRVAFGPGVP
ncbi:MAG TPA: FMN-binding protein [Methylococcaceae bacterium]|nr:FMN-binding protein [Methylococcaceae bacterium]